MTQFMLLLLRRMNMSKNPGIKKQESLEHLEFLAAERAKDKETPKKVERKQIAQKGVIA
jgi:hypothetical protein